jgi:hypothetical protein
MALWNCVTCHVCCSDHSIRAFVCTAIIEYQERDYIPTIRKRYVPGIKHSQIFVELTKTALDRALTSFFTWHAIIQAHSTFYGQPRSGRILAAVPETFPAFWYSTVQLSINSRGRRDVRHTRCNPIDQQLFASFLLLQYHSPVHHRLFQKSSFACRSIPTPWVWPCPRYHTHIPCRHCRP